MENKTKTAFLYSAAIGLTTAVLVEGFNYLTAEASPMEDPRQQVLDALKEELKKFPVEGKWDGKMLARNFYLDLTML